MPNETGGENIKNIARHLPRLKSPRGHQLRCNRECLLQAFNLYPDLYLYGAIAVDFDLVKKMSIKFTLLHIKTVKKGPKSS